VVAGADELGAEDLAAAEPKRFDDDEAPAADPPPNSELTAGPEDAGVVAAVEPRLNKLLGADDAAVVDACVAGALDAEGKLKAGLEVAFEEVDAAGPDVAVLFKPENRLGPPAADVGAAGLLPNNEGPPEAPAPPNKPPPAWVVFAGGGPAGVVEFPSPKSLNLVAAGVLVAALLVGAAPNIGFAPPALPKVPPLAAPEDEGVAVFKLPKRLLVEGAAEVAAGLPNMVEVVVPAPALALVV
jgi:hypothetical protein